MRNAIGISSHRKSAYRKSTNPVLYAMLAIIIMANTSCSTQEKFTKRQYTDGEYHNLNLGILKHDKKNCSVSEVSTPDTVKQILCDKPFQIIIGKLNVPDAEELRNPINAVQDRNPEIFNVVDSSIARMIIRDTTLFRDSLPECIETALSGQAMVGVGTVGGLATLAAPELIWFTWIAIIGAPVFFLISLIAGVYALGQIAAGNIDRKFNRYMKIWAICMLINVCLAAILITMWPVT